MATRTKPTTATSVKARALRSRGRKRAEGAAFPLPPAKTALPTDYPVVLEKLKQRIAAAQTRAALAVNRELIALYWHIGATIAQRQARANWGDAIVERLAHDLRSAFPKLEGFSPRNIWRMRAFYLAWSSASSKLPQAVAETRVRNAGKQGMQTLPQAVADIPWGHNIALLEQLETPAARLWYAGQVRANGWSRATLQEQMAKRAHLRHGKAANNFAHMLPAPQSELALQALKDPYTFDFLTIGQPAHERATERDLIAHVREFLLELGAGFAFVGNQVKLNVGDNDYFLDLLFYHVRLHCYVVVELKANSFKPEHAGKMNFYLSAVDDLLKGEQDQPSIGLLLCRSRNKLQAEYALRDINKPIGVAQWQTKLVERLPARFKGSLPSVAEIESELSGELASRKAKDKVKQSGKQRITGSSR